MSSDCKKLPCMSLIRYYLSRGSEARACISIYLYTENGVQHRTGREPILWFVSKNVCSTRRPFSRRRQFPR